VAPLLSVQGPGARDVEHVAKVRHAEASYVSLQGPGRYVNKLHTGMCTPPTWAQASRTLCNERPTGQTELALRCNTVIQAAGATTP
jgi:hypothetical protein